MKLPLPNEEIKLFRKIIYPEHDWFESLCRAKQERYVMARRYLFQSLRENMIDVATPKKSQITFVYMPGKIICYFAGNSTGKSFSACQRISMELMGEHPLQKQGIRPMPPLYWRVCAPNFEDYIERLIVPEFKKWIRKCYQPNYEMKRKLLTLNNGSKVEFLSFDQDILAHGGSARDGVWHDEPSPKHIWEEDRMRLRNQENSLTLFTLTPVEESPHIPWIYSELYEKSIDVDPINGDPEIRVVFGDTLDNPVMTKEKMRTMVKGLSKEQVQIRTKGTFMVLAGRVFEEFNKEIHVRPVFPVPGNWTRFMSMDYHDRAAVHVLWMAIDEYGKGWIYNELVSQGTYKTIAELIHMKERGETITSRFVDPLACSPDRSGGDGYGVTSAQKEFARYGVYMRPWTKGNAGVRKVRDWFVSNRLFIFDNCKNVISQIEHNVWDEYSLPRFGEDPKTKIKTKNKHFPDCIKGILEANPVHVEGEAISQDQDIILRPTDEIAQKLMNFNFREETIRIDREQDYMKKTFIGPSGYRRPLVE